MGYLIDTAVLVRLANTKDAQHGVAAQAVLELHRRGEALHITPQVLIEFRNVATRPVAVNGLGLSTGETENLSALFESRFSLLPDSPDIFPAWKDLVEKLGVSGKRVHDARIVAVCHVHQVTHILTFNVSHFTQMAGHRPGLVVVDPPSV